MRISAHDKLLLLVERWAESRGMIVERSRLNSSVLEVGKNTAPYFGVRLRQRFFELPSEISVPYDYLNENSLQNKVLAALDRNLKNHVNHVQAYE